MTNPFALSEIQGSVPQDAGNPYSLETIQGEARVDLHRSLLGAMDIDPDQAARTVRLSRQVGAPYEAVQANLPEVERSAKLDEYKRMLAGAPKLGAFMRNPQNAQIAHDDVGVLSRTENVLQEWAGPAASFSSVIAGLAKSLPQGAELARQGLRQQFADMMGFEDMAADARRKYAQADAFVGFSTPAFENSTARGLYSGGSSLIRQLPGLAASILTRSTAPMLATAGIQTEAEAYGKYTARGATPGQAFIGAAGEGTVEVATEMLPMGFLVEKFGKVGAGKFLSGLLAREIPGEQVATLAQDATDTAVANPDKTWGEFVSERPDAAYQTLLATLTQTGAMGAVNLMAERAQRSVRNAHEASNTAEQNAATLQTLAELSQASKLRQRDPEAFAQFVADATDGGPIADVFIGAQTLAQSGKVREIAAVSPAVAEQLPQALESGGDVRIPVHEFAAQIAGNGYAQDIINDLKTEPDGMTRTEALAFRQSQEEQIHTDELAQMADEQVRNLTHAEEVRGIERQVVEQLDSAGRFSPAVNRAYAALPTAFFDTMSERLGVPPGALWEAYGAKINAEGMAGPMLSQDERGGFVPREFTKDDKAVVGLFKNADLSTFLHESGHWFLESYADMAKAAPVLESDMQTLLDWFDVQDLSTWHGMALEEKRTHHEQFARGFEQYLHEGKAPSLGLQGLFARFRAWLARVYSGIKGQNVELSDEVRAVLNRMLATEAHIEEAQRARSMSPLFATVEDATAHGIDWQQYQALGREATSEALASLEARSMRDMTWTGKLRETTIKRLNREATDKRKEIRREVEAEVAKEPTYAAMRWLKRGEMTTPEGEAIKAEVGHRLSIPALREMYPESALGAVDWQRLGYGKYGMLAEEGLHPDLVAEMFGFPSGDGMVRQLLDAEKFRNVVEAVTDQRMLEQYGELSSPEAIARAADEAIHNDVRGRFVATELAGLQKAMGGAQVLAKMAKDYAARMIENQKAGGLRPTQYAAAEVRAGKAAEAALKKGDIEEAIRQKRFQLIQHAATRAAYGAQAEVQSTVAAFKAIADAKPEQLRTRNVDLVNAAHAILAEHGVGMRGKQPRQYMDAVKAYDPELFATLEPMLQDAEQGAKPLADLTVGELRALRDDIESLWYLARRERQVEVDGKLIDRQQIAQELTGRLEELGVPDEVPGEGKAVTEGEKRVRYLMGLRAALRRVEAWVDRMDGGNITGGFRRFVFQPISEAADHYRADAGAYLKRYRDLLKAIEPTLKPGRIAAPELGYTFGFSKGDAGKAELLHAILHTGNESNKRKLLLGRGWAAETEAGTLDTTRWDAFTHRMVEEGKLTKADFDFAQGVWDLLEETKPLAQKTHREVFGRYFDEITADEFTTPFGTYRGGYVPAIYDTFEVQDAAVNAELDAINQGNAFMFPATNRGFTKGRVEYNKPLALDLRLLPQHLDKVLLFAHLEPRVRDVMRTLRAKGFAGTLTRYDPVAYTDLLLPWLNRAAKQTVETPATGWAGKLGDRFFRSMRSRSGMAAMFANVTNALQQITGLSITAIKVKPAHLKAATWRYLRAPSEVAEQVAELSTFMANRQTNEVQQMRTEINDLLLNPNAYEKTLAWTAKHAYFLQSAFQNVVDNITWAAAFEQATTQGHDQTTAVRAADAAVRETQGSLQPEDISRFESGPAFARMFTQFQSYFNMQANLLGTEFAKVAQDMGVKKGAGRLFYVFLLGFLVPAWFSEAIVQAMRGGPDDDDHDGYLDEFLAFFFGAPLRSAAAMVPVAGQASMLVANSFNRKPYDDRMSTAPAVSMIESAASAPHSIYKAIADDGSAKRAIRDTLTLVSIATGIPVAVLSKPLGYGADVAQGRVQPAGPVDALRGAVSGVASPDSKR